METGLDGFCKDCNKVIERGAIRCNECAIKIGIKRKMKVSTNKETIRVTETENFIEKQIDDFGRNVKNFIDSLKIIFKKLKEKQSEPKEKSIYDRLEDFLHVRCNASEQTNHIIPIKEIIEACKIKYYKEFEELIDAINKMIENEDFYNSPCFEFEQVIDANTDKDSKFIRPWDTYIGYTDDHFYIKGNIESNCLGGEVCVRAKKVDEWRTFARRLIMILN